jgi:hypothetical protein
MFAESITASRHHSARALTSTLGLFKKTEGSGLLSTALLELSALWYPPLGKEDTDGRAGQSGGVARAARVFG